MREFGGLSAFIGHLSGLPAAIGAAEQAGRLAAVEMVRRSVVATAGETGSADTGPFAPWPALAAATQRARERHGFAADEPELATGALMASVQGMVAADGRAAVGIADAMVGSGRPGDAFRNIGDVAVAQEEGTDSVPARSFLGVGAFRAAQQAAAAFAGPVVAAVAEEPPSERVAEGNGSDGDDRSL